jgi:predicted phage-related endonuclease
MKQVLKQNETRSVFDAETLWAMYGKISKPQQVIADQTALGIVAELKTIKSLQESLKAKDYELRTRLLSIMREADTLVDAQGQVLLTWRATAPRQTVDTAYLKRAYPDIYREVLREGEPSRRLVLK